MSGLGQKITDAPSLDVVASDATYGRTFAPRTNSALQLADALQGITPEVQQLGAAISKQQQEEASVAAKKAALENGGKELAQAVREGKISATQNPFFVRDYNREAAYVRANSAISNLTTQSQEWAEAGDPKAYQSRFAKELSELGAAYNTDKDAQEGFLAAAAPAQQQAFAANTAKVSATMIQERNQNLSALTTQTIQDVNKQYGGKASSAQIYNALEPLKAHYLGTGGTEPEWNKLLYSGVTSAAYNSGNQNLLDILKDARPGGGVPLASLPGMADQISVDKYRIMQSHTEGLHLQAQAVRDQADLEGRAVATNAFKDPNYGIKLLTGDFDVQTFIKQQVAQGHSIQGISSALNSIQATVADSQSLALAKARSFETSPNGGAYILGLHQRAETEGYTPQLQDEVGQLVLRGDMSFRDGDALIDKARQTSTQAQPTGAFGAHPARTKALQAATAQYSGLRNGVIADVTQMVQYTNQGATATNKAGMSQADIKNLQTLANQAASTYLATHAGDFQGARKAGQEAAGYWMQSHLSDYVGTK